MTRPACRQPAHSWMAGFTHTPSVEAACEALEQRLREDTPHPFADAPRVHLEAEWWGN